MSKNPAVSNHGDASSNSISLDDEAPAWGDDRPVPAQPGWYRLGRNFYRSGSGPFPGFGGAAGPREPARVQLTLF